jgi:hypothetical protein
MSVLPYRSPVLASPLARASPRFLGIPASTWLVLLAFIAFVGGLAAGLLVA